MMTQALTFPLQSLREPVTQVRIRLTAAELELPIKAARYRGPVEVELELARAGEGVHVRGEVRVPIEVSCVRCLSPVETELRAPVEVVARPRPSAEETRRDVGEDFLYYDGDSLDLAGEVREALVLEVPSNPVCREDCRGLCSRCGENLNVGECRCAEHGAADSRWSALASLLPDGESRSGLNVAGEEKKPADSDMKGS